MPTYDGSWTKIATVTALTCTCLGLVYEFCIWLDKHFYIRFGSPSVEHGAIQGTVGDFGPSK